MRVGCHAQSACLTDLVHVRFDQVVADAVPPLDHLPWPHAQCQPVPGQGDGLLAQDYEQIVTGEVPPGSVRVGGVVFGDGDEVQAARPGGRRQLRWRQLTAMRTR